MNPVSTLHEPLLIDFALRGGVVALLALAMFGFLKAAPSRSGGLGVALALVTMVSVLSDMAPVVGADWIGPALKAAGVTAIPLFWLFTRSWFDDAFELGAGDIGIVGVYVALGVFLAFEAGGSHRPVQAADSILYVGGAALTLDTLRHAWRGRSTDLVESRRRVRTAFVAVVSAVILWTMLAEIAGRLAHASMLADLAGTGGLALGTFGLALLLFGLRHEEMFAPAVRPGVGFDESGPVPDAKTEPVDDPLADALHQVMSEERLYRAPDLTIGGIASRLNVPEYRLRRLVNGRFGYRNISDYLNGLRIAEVREALVDPAQARVPILTIAMDAGFGSLAVFNRAFKAREGETPSAFRRRHLARTAPAD